MCCVGVVLVSRWPQCGAASDLHCGCESSWVRGSHGEPWLEQTDFACTTPVRETVWDKLHRCRLAGCVNCHLLGQWVHLLAQLLPLLDLPHSSMLYRIAILIDPLQDNANEQSSERCSRPAPTPQGPAIAICHRIVWRKLLLQVKVQKHLHWVVQIEVVCFDPWPWCHIAPPNESDPNTHLIRSNWVQWL